MANNKFKRLFVDGIYGQMHLRLRSPDNPSKRPLVCLHMFPQSGRSYVNLLNQMNDERIIIAPDFPGYGESDPPPEPIDASDYAAAIWHLIDQLDLLLSNDSVDLFGIHAGAKLATELAYQRPDSVNQIILSSAAVLYPKELQRLKAAFHPVPLDDQGTRFQNLWNIVVRNRGPQQTYEMMAAGFAEILRAGEHYEWGHHAVYEFNQRFPEILKSLLHKVSLLNPKDDLYEMTARSVPYLQNGTLYDFPEWGQGFLESNAHELAQTIIKILNQDNETVEERSCQHS